MIDRLGFRALSTAIAVVLLGILLSGTSGASAHNADGAIRAEGAAQPGAAGQQREREADPREEDALVGLGEPVVRFGARARGPAKDYPRFPKRCLGPNEIIPHSPQKCRLVRFVKGRPTVVLWGDSHAWQHIPALRRAARQRNVNLVAFVFGSCPPFKQRLRGPKKYDHLCQYNNALALDWVTRRERAGAAIRVVLGGFWWADGDAYANPSNYQPYQVRIARLFHYNGPKLFRALGARGIDTHVIGQAGTVPRDPPFCADRHPYACPLPRNRAIPYEHRIKRWLRDQMTHLPANPRLINVNGRFCGPNRCQGYKGGIHTFFDDHHLSATRTRTLKRTFLPSFRNFR